MEIPRDKWVEKLVEAVREVRHGSVEVVIQDSRVIQLNKVEKIRFAKDEEAPDAALRRSR